MHTLGKAEQFDRGPVSRGDPLTDSVQGRVHVCRAREFRLATNIYGGGFAEIETGKVKAGCGCIGRHIFYFRMLYRAQWRLKTTKQLKMPWIFTKIVRRSIASNASLCNSRV